MKVLTLSVVLLCLVTVNSCEKDCRCLFCMEADNPSADANGETINVNLYCDYYPSEEASTYDFWLTSITAEGEKVDISSLGNVKKRTTGNFMFRGEWFAIHRVSDTLIEVIFEKNETAKPRYLEFEMTNGYCSGTASLRQKSH